VLLTGCGGSARYPTLVEAAANNDKNSFKKHLSADPDILEMTDAAGWTPLLHSIKNGNVDFVKDLLKFGANPDNGGASGETPLTMVILYNGDASESILELLLENGAAINLGNREGETPLHTAVWRGSPALVKDLLKSKAHPNQPNKCGETPLHRAAMQTEDKALDILLVLLKAKADPNKQDNRGKTTLITALENPSEDSEKIIAELVGDPGRPPVVNLVGENEKKRLAPWEKPISPTTTAHPP